MQIYSVPSVILGPNFFLSPPFSNTHSLCSNKGQQISHLYKATGKFVVLYSLFIKFYFSKLEDER